jgi:hypothetical protein
MPSRAAVPAAPRHCRLRRWTPYPTRAHRRPSIPRPSLYIPRASRAAHCAAPPRASPESVRPRARRRGLVAAARRSSSQLCHRHQSARGEPHCAPVPLVALVRPYLAAGELPPPPPQGHSCEIQGHMSELGTCLQRKLSWFLYQLVQRIRKSLENCRNSENCKTNFVGFVLMNTTTFVIPTSSDSGYF